MQFRSCTQALFKIAWKHRDNVSYFDLHGFYKEASAYFQQKKNSIKFTEKRRQNVIWKFADAAYQYRHVFELIKLFFYDDEIVFAMNPFYKTRFAEHFLKDFFKEILRV